MPTGCSARSTLTYAACLAARRQGFSRANANRIGLTAPDLAYSPLRCLNPLSLVKGEKGARAEADVDVKEAKRSRWLMSRPDIAEALPMARKIHKGEKPKRVSKAWMSDGFAWMTKI